MLYVIKLVFWKLNAKIFKTFDENALSVIVCARISSVGLLWVNFFFWVKLQIFPCVGGENLEARVGAAEARISLEQKYPADFE